MLAECNLADRAAPVECVRRPVQRHGHHLQHRLRHPGLPPAPGNSAAAVLTRAANETFGEYFTIMEGLLLFESAYYLALSHLRHDTI